MSKAGNRLDAETVDISLGVDDSGKRHTLAVSLAYDGDTNLLREIVFVGRGKIGHGLDHMLHDLSIKLSRVLQHRDPETGTIPGL